MMLRVRWSWVGVILLLAVFVLNSSFPAGAQQDEAESTISALQTQVAELSPTVTPSASTPAPREMPDQESGGLEIVVGDGYVSGNAFFLIPAGDAGELSVVAVGSLDASGAILPVLVRNNTSREVADVTISGVARSADGRVLAAGGSQFVRPHYVLPGTLALGYIYFDGVDIPSNAAFEFEVEATPPGEVQYDSTRDLEIVEASLFEDRVVGELQNAQDGVIEGPIGVSVLCFDLDGALLGQHQAFVEESGLPPGETVSFQATLATLGQGCPAFLIASSANCPSCPPFPAVGLTSDSEITVD